MTGYLVRILRRLTGWPPSPPTHSEKQSLITRYAQRFGTPTFVETGTFRGDMVEAQKPHFQRIVTIELDEVLHRAATERFQEDKKVQVLHGDSGSVLLPCIQEIEGSILYWLDGHYSGGSTSRASGETPIERELGAVVKRSHSSDVILIDDARLFGWRSGYPSIRYLRRYVEKNLPFHDMTVECDVICIFPAEASRGNHAR